MKVLATILVIVFLGLSVMPCADDSNTCANADIQKLATDSHSKNEHHTTHCSPLCVCGCCSTVVASIEFELIEEIPTFDNSIKEKDDLKLPIVSTIYYAIWQPPQII